LENPINRQTLGDLLRRATRRHPGRTAIQCGSTAWTYAEFDALCNRLANGLIRRGVTAGDRVAVLSRNSHTFAAMRFALARIGAVLVPVNFMLKAQEAAYVLRHCRARMLCVDSALAALGREAAALDTAIEQYVWLPGEELAAPEPGMTAFDQLLDADAAPPAASLDGRMPLQLIYTSGTESLPKGALLTHEAVLWQYVSCNIDGEVAEADRILHSLPLFHCAQLDCFLGPGIYVGAVNVITARPQPDNLLKLMQQHRISSFFAPPTVWIALLRSPLFDGADLGALRKGYYGASIMPVEVLREMGRRLPQVRFWNFYGQTEIAPLAAVLKPEDQLRKPGSAGRPALNVETRIVDDAGNDVPPGEVGEIVHRSPQLLSGYYDDAERTAAAFQGGWFHSGDLAVMDDEGYITIVDRKKDMIKSGGENVASREVEEMIYRLPQVSEVAVVGLPHPRWVEAVAAVVVLRPGAELTETAVVAHCQLHMAAFKVPKRVVFTDALPKNPSGKLLKRDLRRQYQRVMEEAAADSQRT
jgi:fatty-acyl-CoA synthase